MVMHQMQCLALAELHSCSRCYTAHRCCACIAILCALVRMQQWQWGASMQAGVGTAAAVVQAAPAAAAADKPQQQQQVV
jgi:hypothetical protein